MAWQLSWPEGYDGMSSPVGVLHRHCFFFGRATWQDKGFEDQVALHFFFFFFDVLVVFVVCKHCTNSIAQEQLQENAGF
jgi:hypothetical protein